MGADVWLLDRNVDALRRLWTQFDRQLNTVYSTRDAIDKHVLDADLVIGGVLVAGAKIPKLMTADHIKRMKPGSVVVDVAIDQGESFETSKATAHDEATNVVDDVVYYCVGKMPRQRTADFSAGLEQCNATNCSGDCRQRFA